MYDVDGGDKFVWSLIAKNIDKFGEYGRDFFELFLRVNG